MRTNMKRISNLALAGVLILGLRASVMGQVSTRDSVLAPRPGSDKQRVQGTPKALVGNRTSPKLSPESYRGRPMPMALLSFGNLPLSFEVNKGQTDRRVQFLSRGRGYTLFLTGNEAVLSLRQPRSGSADPKAAGSAAFSGVLEPRAADLQTKSALQGLDTTAVRLKLVGASPRGKLVGDDELPGKSNYFIGNDPTKWRTNVSTYAKVRYKDVYPGVDLEYFGNQGQVEHDFIVGPGADPNAIKLSVAVPHAGSPSLNQSPVGTPALQLMANGDLKLRVPGGDVTLKRPQVYQTVEGARRVIPASYALVNGREFGFQLGRYDSKLPLVIDPVLAYSTYLGGSGFEEGNAIAVDGSGNAYVTGQTASANFPTSSPFQASFDGGSLGIDPFVAKLNAAGSALVYSTYLGGDGVGEGIAVDSSGNAYVAGWTQGTDFPTVNPYQASNGGGFADVFFAELNPTGSALLYSTYLGGSAFDVGLAIAIDSSGDAYVTGQTQSSGSFPTTAGAFQTACSGFVNFQGSAIVAKFDPTKSGNASLIYSTCLGGTNGDAGHAIAVDGSGNAYVTGLTFSSDFPTTFGAFQTLIGGFGNAFVTKLNSSGSGLIDSTYLGGNPLGGCGGDQGYGIALDASDNGYITGIACSKNFPTANPLQAANAGGADIFVTKLNPAGSALVYSTYLGGSNNEVGRAIAVDSSGNAYVTGYTSSANFPTANPVQATNAGGNDAFVAELNATGTALVYSTYLGGSGNDDGGLGIAVDTAGNAYIAGFTNSTNFPVTAGAFQINFGGGNGDAFVAKIGPAYAAQIQQPINPDGSSVFNVKRGVVPVKFTLTLDGVATCNLPPATISLVRTAGATTGSVDESVYLSPSDSGSNFRIDTTDCQYVYNLGTSSLGTGTYQVNISIGGRVVGSGVFGLQ